MAWGAIVLGAFCGLSLFAGIFWGVFRLTRPLAEAGTAFLTAFAREPSEAVWSGRTTDRFRQDVPWSEFAAIIDRFGLDQARDVFWNTRKIRSRHGVLRGWFQSPTGRVRVSMDLVRSNGLWLVDRLSLKPGG